MERIRQEQRAEDVIEVRAFLSIVRRIWWKALLLSLTVGALTLLVTLQMPNIYQATAVISPAIDEGKKSQAWGALSLLGVDIAGPSTVESLETIFKSNDLTVRVFQKYDIWPVVLGSRYDPSTGKIRVSWSNRLFGNEVDSKTPTDWDAIRLAKECLKISNDKKSGTVSVSFECPSADSSANVVKYYLEEAKNRLQEEALGRASRNKKFITEQISKTIDPLTRDRLYGLFGQEVEREMLARNREQFAFVVIDLPRVPDKKIRPRRAVATMFAGLMASVILLGYYIKSS